MKIITAIWEGYRPLVMHNQRLVDPTYFYTQKIRDITNKGSKKTTADDYKNRNRFEWEGGLYWDDKLGPVIPGDNVEACIRDGARVVRLGAAVEAFVVASQSEFKLNYTGPRTKDKLYAQPLLFVYLKSVVIGKSRVMRCRPMFPTGWSLNVSVEYDETMINGKDITRAMRDAGALKGLGDRRPKFGRFAATILSGGEDDGVVPPKDEDTTPGTSAKEGEDTPEA